MIGIALYKIVVNQKKQVNDLRTMKETLITGWQYKGKFNYE